MTDYQLVNEGAVYRVKNGSWIPVDEKNRHYQEYLDWVKAGNIPDPYPVSELPTEEKRTNEYPSVSEQLAALYEARHGDTKSLEAIDARIAATNQKYPKLGLR